MALAIAIRFLAGHAHLHHWHAHHSDGVIDWPPSPWRLMRALVAVAGRRLTTLPLPEETNIGDADGDLIPLNRFAGLLARLAQAPPDIWLPRTSFGHTRHFFPVATGSTGSAVFDSFAVVPREKPLVYSWQNVPDLTEDESRDLDRLLGRLSYFGRSESWCEATRHDTLPSWVDDNHGYTRCPAVETVAGCSGWKEHQDYDSVPKLAAVVNTNDEADSIRRLLTLAVSNQQQRHRLACSLADDGFSNLLLRCLLRQSGQDLSDGLERPIGTRWIHYAVPRAIYQLPSAPRAAARPKVAGPPVTLVRFALNTATVNRPVLPQLTDTLLVADKFRAAALAWHHHVQREFPEDQRHPRNLCGREADNSRVNGHDHAFFWPTDEDNDGFIDHVSVYCPAGFLPVEVDALRRLLRIRQRGGRPDLLVTPIFVGDSADFGPWKSAATVFASATPYYCPVNLSHGKKSGGKDRSVEVELRRSLRLIGVIPSETEPVKIREIVFVDATDGIPATWARADLADSCYRTAWLKPPDEPFIPGIITGLQVDGGTRLLRALAFCRHRRRHVIEGAGRMFSIEFASKRVARPFSIGSQAHFGLGLFVPVGSETGRLNQTATCGDNVHE